MDMQELLHAANNFNRDEILANKDLDLVEILNEGKVVIDYPAGNKRGRQWTPGQQIEATMYALRYNNPGQAYDEIRINDRTRWRRRS